MAHTDEDTGSSLLAGTPQDEAHVTDGNGSSDGGHGSEEEAFFYPRRRGYELLSRVGDWSYPRTRKLLQPEPFVTFVVVAACVIFTFVQFEPSNLFRNTTISGGDTGAHVLLPWVAQHQLLSSFRLTGWTSSNWDGFPAVTFYFPIPVYTVVGLAQVIPYNIAFKLVTAAPMILMPVAGWLLGRISKAPFPIPAVLAAATLPYIFGTEFTIYGGNIASTLAGEYAFAWGLWFALVFFGIVMRGLQTGRYRAWAAVIFACCFMSHIDPAIFAGVGAAVLVVTYALRAHDWRGAIRWALPTIVIGGLLAAWWAYPFEVRFPYVTNMGYQRITTYLSTLFPTGDTWLFILAGVGASLSIARRRRIGEFLAIIAVLAALAFRFMPQSILWNARVLPFWFLMLYLLGGLAVAELYATLAERTTNFTVTLRAALLPAPLAVLVLVLIWVGFPLRILPGEHAAANGDYTFLGIPQRSESFVPGWISWNYSGYQSGCPASCAKVRWPEYEQIVAELEKASKTYGCGNVMWEYQSEMNDYGTPDALTILPYWTNGCIGSMEGLYYEASATTPFHFINQSELSLQPSDPMVGLPYASSPDVALGVHHLQMLGVKYYMALNTALQKQAAADPSLKLIATLGPYNIAYSGSSTGPQGTQRQFWKLYLIRNSPRAYALGNQPVVMKGLNNSSQPKYLHVMTTWYDDPSAWDVYLAASGPSNWARVPYGDTNVPVKPELATKVSGIVEHNASISFNVSRTGVPVVVTVSYFPNWHVSGAKGVYRVSPNLMVVVPTSHHVSMSYGYTPVDFEGWGLTLLALVGLFFLFRHPIARMAAVRRPALGEREGRSPGEEAVYGTVNRFWGRVRGPEEQPTSWADFADHVGPPGPGTSAAAGHAVTGAAVAGTVAAGAVTAGTAVAATVAAGAAVAATVATATSPANTETEGREEDGAEAAGAEPDGHTVQSDDTGTPPPEGIASEAAAAVAETSATETSDSETSATDASDAEPPGTETSDAETSDAETNDAETPDAEPSGTEMSGTETSGAEADGQTAQSDDADATPPEGIATEAVAATSTGTSGAGAEADGQTAQSDDADVTPPEGIATEAVEAASTETSGAEADGQTAQSDDADATPPEGVATEAEAVGLALGISDGSQAEPAAVADVDSTALAETAEAETSQPETSQAETGQMELAGEEANQAEPAGEETGQAGPGQAETPAAGTQTGTETAETETETAETETETAETETETAETETETAETQTETAGTEATGTEVGDSDATDPSLSLGAPPARPNGDSAGHAEGARPRLPGFEEPSPPDA